MENSWGFSFAGRTIDYFGSRAITSDTTAIFELIKNSRDANAKHITIHFKDFKTERGEIDVYDDGDGMSIDDIKNKWMVIGTDSRLKDSKTKNGKPVWGEMGIGRMACQKLGKEIKLISVKNNQKIEMTFDWERFNKSDVTVDKIKFLAKTHNVRNVKCGLMLKIQKLKSKWDSKKIKELKDELSILISNEIIDDVIITVKVGSENGEIIGKNYVGLYKNVLLNAPFRLKAKFDGEKLTVLILGQVGQQGLWEEQDVQPFAKTNVGPFSVDLYHFPRSPGKRKGTTLENYYETRIGTEKLESFLRNYRGLYLYRDGAWMKPYGGDNDWLALEAGARQETSKIGIKQIYGQMNLSKKKNPMIQPASHRETLIDNHAFRDLKKITEQIFDILRIYMKKFKDKEQVKTLRGMGAPAFKPEDNVKVILKKMSFMTKYIPPKEQKQYKLYISGLDTITSIQQQNAADSIVQMGEMRNYEKNLVTLGIATSFMAREVTDPLERNMELVAEGEEMRKRIINDDGQLSKKDQIKTERMLKSMQENQNKMLHFMKFVNILTDHIARSIRNNKLHTQVDVFECWNMVSDGFQDRESELGITTIHDWSNRFNKRAKENLVVKIDRVDLECLFTNLHLNSIESLRKSKETKKKITVHYWYHNRSLHIEFSDNGVGIPAGKLEEVFEPFKFGHSQNNKNMHGHGLGLYIVKKIMENYNGTAKAVDVKQGAKIELIFPNMQKIVS